jgi:endonuclease/exonuclease/phosphatase (EEP) superfamily protein YafD
VLLLLLACADPPPPAVPGAGPALKVLSYNVNFERFDEATVDAIAEADADVVFLQETTTEWEEAIGERLAERYPTRVFHAWEPDGGMAVLSAGAVEVRERLDSPVGKFPATCLTVETTIGPIDALHVHLHPPLDEGGLLTGYFTTTGKRRTEIEAYAGCFGADPDVILGDFNEEEGDATAFVEGKGFRDAASAVGTPERTWSWQTDWVELTGRPDHVYYGPELTPSAVEVLDGGPSDHRPLLVTLQRPE